MPRADRALMNLQRGVCFVPADLRPGGEQVRRRDAGVRQVAGDAPSPSPALAVEFGAEEPPGDLGSTVGRRAAGVPSSPTRSRTASQAAQAIAKPPADSRRSAHAPPDRDSSISNLRRERGEARGHPGRRSAGVRRIGLCRRTFRNVAEHVGISPASVFHHSPTSRHPSGSAGCRLQRLTQRPDKSFQN